MAVQWKPQSIEVYESWTDTILDEVSEALNEWEFNFVTSIKNQLIMCRQLSEKQATILEKIYSEKTK